MPPDDGCGCSRRSTWALLLSRVFEIDLRCPDCGAQMRIIAAIVRDRAIRAILEHLDLPADIPKTAPSRAPPPNTGAELFADTNSTANDRGPSQQRSPVGDDFAQPEVPTELYCEDGPHLDP